MTWKEIARSLGCYHPTYLSRLWCSTWNLGSIYCAEAIAGEPEIKVRSPVAAGEVRPQESQLAPAVSEAKPDDSPLGDS